MSRNVAGGCGPSDLAEVRRERGPRPLATLILLTLTLHGCTELYRWPDRMSRRPAPARAEIPPEGHYVVKPGDTVYSIAFRYQLDFRELAAWNDIGSDYLIHPGEVIRLTSPPNGGIRTAAAVPPAAPGPARPVPDPPAERRYEAPPETVVKLSWRWPTAGSVVKPFGDGGKVVYSGGALKGYGELIIIKHDDVHLSAYGYNRRRLVGEGVTVAAGQPIAELGLGPEQKPVLHFEVRRRGKPVDPASYLPAP